MRVRTRLSSLSLEGKPLAGRAPATVESHGRIADVALQRDRQAGKPVVRRGFCSVWENTHLQFVLRDSKICSFSPNEPCRISENEMWIMGRRAGCRFRKLYPNRYAYIEELGEKSDQSLALA